MTLDMCAVPAVVYRIWILQAVCSTPSDLGSGVPPLRRRCFLNLPGAGEASQAGSARWAAELLLVEAEGTAQRCGIEGAAGAGGICLLDADAGGGGHTRQHATAHNQRGPQGPLSQLQTAHEPASQPASQPASHSPHLWLVHALFFLLHFFPGLPLGTHPPFMQMVPLGQV